MSHASLHVECSGFCFHIFHVAAAVIFCTISSYQHRASLDRLRILDPSSPSLSEKKKNGISRFICDNFGGNFRIHTVVCCLHRGANLCVINAYRLWRGIWMSFICRLLLSHIWPFASVCVCVRWLNANPASNVSIECMCRGWLRCKHTHTHAHSRRNDYLRHNQHETK